MKLTIVRANLNWKLVKVNQLIFLINKFELEIEFIWRNFY
jgi:hypothetical protein